MSRGGDPLDLYAKLKSIASKMSAPIRNPPVGAYIEGRLTNLRFLFALPSEYDACVERLRTEASGEAFSPKPIQEVVGDRFKSLQQSGKSGQGSKALLAGSGNPARGRGGKSRLQSGAETSADGGTSNSNSAPTAPTSTAPAAAPVPVPALAPVSVPARDVRRCHVCNATHHLMNSCPKRVCPTCGDRGQGADQCPTHAGVLATIESESTDCGLMALELGEGECTGNCTGETCTLSEPGLETQARRCT